ncbi:MAG: ion channel [Deltaproteobacteria bacterium]|nr:ion channel [Deltaproteobacteria bacterium]
MGGPLQTSPSVSSAQPHHGGRRSRGAGGDDKNGGRPSGGTPPQVFTMKGVNQRSDWFADAYHWLLNVSWPVFVLMIVGGYLSANLIFASIYTMIPDAIKGSDGFVDNYFFSVQTWATIGYGGMTPNGLLPNVVVVLESMTGIFGVALLTGLLFAKFSRPASRVLFANKAVISIYSGKPTLMIRLANERLSQIVEAAAHLTLIREETTIEGTKMRRIHDLKLVRDTQPLFRLSWTVMHVIDESSALFGLDQESARLSDTRIFLSVMGYDASVGQTAHASTVYGPEQVVFGARYRDATSTAGSNVVLDFAKFHDTEDAPLL